MIMVGVNRTKIIAFLLLMCCCIGVVMRTATAQSSTYYNYQDLYETQYVANHIEMESSGAQVQLVLDTSGGAGFQSKSSYIYGFFSASMKLVPGYSAGTVSAFFLSSSGAYHDELDFEFLGNVSGQPYTLQTNVFANGVGGREQRLHLWFDPAAAFHNYGIVWNHEQIIFTVDQTPVRIFKNLQSLGHPYPSSQAVQAFGDIYEASSWATQGGTVPINWSYAPFNVGFGAFQLASCVYNGVDVTACQTDYQANWWESSEYTSLSSSQMSDLQFVQKTYLIYDYCTDLSRYPTQPFECPYNA